MALPEVTSMERWQSLGESDTKVRIRFSNGAILHISPLSDEFGSFVIPEWPSGGHTDGIAFDGLSARSAAFEVLSAVAGAKGKNDYHSDLHSDLSDYPEIEAVLTE